MYCGSQYDKDFSGGIGFAALVKDSARERKPHASNDLGMAVPVAGRAAALCELSIMVKGR